MDYLKPVAVGETDLCPVIARNDLEIELNCHSVSLQPHLRNESGEGGRALVCLGLSIDL